VKFWGGRRGGVLSATRKDEEKWIWYGVGKEKGKKNFSFQAEKKGLEKEKKEKVQKGRIKDFSEKEEGALFACPGGEIELEKGRSGSGDVKRGGGFVDFEGPAEREGKNPWGGGRGEECGRDLAGPLWKRERK